MDLITLRAGHAGIGLAPAAGGAVTRYGFEAGTATIEWLRPTSPEALVRGDPYEMAGFPLVPYSLMPTELVSPPPAWDPGRGLRVDAVGLDNCFTGWGRRAVIEWPEWHARLVMTADPPLDCLMVYTPPGRDFFCVEPVSHATDAVNLAAAGRTDTGLLTLEPGETVGAAITLTPWSRRGRAG